MNKMNAKIKIVAVMIAAVACVGTSFARGPAPHRGHRPGPKPVMHPPKPPPPPHHHKKSGWGKGGRNVLPGFVGGVVGGLVADAVVKPREKVVVVTPPPVVAPPPVVVAPPPPVVVAPPPPVHTTQRVWVEGCYINQVQPNGTVVRVWQPGHYEMRQVIVQ